MGTDIYLEWDGKSEEDKKAQITGFDITAGRVGYLRASIGMIKENQILRELFPDCWDGGEIPYDFLGNEDQLSRLAKKYISSELFKIEMKEITEGQQRQIEMGTMLTTLFKSLGCDVVKGTNGEFLWSVRWLNSLIEFFALGMEKQKEGKNPKIYISW